MSKFAEMREHEPPLKRSSLNDKVGIGDVVVVVLAAGAGGMQTGEPTEGTEVVIWVGVLTTVLIRSLKVKKPSRRMFIEVFASGPETSIIQ